MARTLTHQETLELRRLYDSFSIAVERASAAMHMKGMDSQAFRIEDVKVAAIWSRIRELMGEPAKPWERAQ